MIPDPVLADLRSPAIVNSQENKSFFLVTSGSLCYIEHTPGFVNSARYLSKAGDQVGRWTFSMRILV